LSCQRASSKSFEPAASLHQEASRAAGQIPQAAAQGRLAAVAEVVEHGGDQLPRRVVAALLVLALLQIAAVDGTDDVAVDGRQVERVEHQQRPQQHLLVHAVPVEELRSAVEMDIDVLGAFVGHPRQVLVGAPGGVVEIARGPLLPEDQAAVGKLALEQPLVLADAHQEQPDDIDVGGLEG
jgi:hypothetical protein